MQMAALPSPRARCVQAERRALTAQRARPLVSISLPRSPATQTRTIPQAESRRRPVFNARLAKFHPLARPQQLHALLLQETEVIALRVSLQTGPLLYGALSRATRASQPATTATMRAHPRPASARRGGSLSAPATLRQVRLHQSSVPQTHTTQIISRQRLQRVFRARQVLTHLPAQRRSHRVLYLFNVPQTHTMLTWVLPFHRALRARLVKLALWVRHRRQAVELPTHTLLLRARVILWLITMVV